MEFLKEYWSQLLFFGGLLYHVGYTVKTIKNLNEGQDKILAEQESQEKTNKEQFKLTELKLKEQELKNEQKIAEVAQKGQERHDKLFDAMGVIQNGFIRMEERWYFIQQRLEEIKNKS